MQVSLCSFLFRLELDYGSREIKSSGPLLFLKGRIKPFSYLCKNQVYLRKRSLSLFFLSDLICNTFFVSFFFKVGRIHCFLFCLDVHSRCSSFLSNFYSIFQLCNRRRRHMAEGGLHFSPPLFLSPFLRRFRFLHDPPPRKLRLFPFPLLAPTPHPDHGFPDPPRCGLLFRPATRERRTRE